MARRGVIASWPAGTACADAELFSDTNLLPFLVRFAFPGWRPIDGIVIVGIGDRRRRIARREGFLDRFIQRGLANSAFLGGRVIVLGVGYCHFGLSVDVISVGSICLGRTGLVRARNLVIIMRRGMWRSPVAHLNGVQGVAGSNPVIPIRKSSSSQRPSTSRGFCF